MKKQIDEFARAMAKRRDIQLLLKDDPESAACAIRAIVLPGIYTHFKSTSSNPKRYLVIGPAPDVDSRRWSVSYMALYPPHFAKLASRPLLSARNGFLMPVRRGGYSGKRFTLEEKVPVEELFQHLERYAPSLIPA